MGEPQRKRPPAGLAVNPPVARFAIRDGFHLMAEHPLPDSVTAPQFVAWCADQLTPFAPLHRWFVDALRSG